MAGRGSLQPASGAFSALPISFNERLESGSSTTSPEELIASAHAACYAMSLSNTLAANGAQPQRLEVTAAVELSRSTDGLTIRSSHLDVKASVPRIDSNTLNELASKAEQRCPVSNALRGNIDIQVNAQLVPS
jgi:lipoyl-dependent peroxiredoxin